MSPLSHIPTLGAGLGYRTKIKEEIFAAHDQIDFLEILTDQFVRGSLTSAEVEELCDTFTVIPHGVGLSIGSAAPPAPHYLQQIKRISDITGSPYYSEHLCLTQVPGIDLGHLTPIWFTGDVLNHTIDHVNLVQDTLGKQLVLENVTYTFDVPEATLHQTEFFNRLVERTNCGVLLDVTNVYINATNHGFTAAEFIADMPLAHIAQVHIAGGYWQNGKLVDGHSHPVQDGTWELLGLLAEKTQIKGIILEHDADFPNIDALVSQVQQARTYITAVSSRL